jgi:hypothetical protein
VDVASAQLEKPNSLRPCIRHVQGFCTNDAGAGILIAQKEETQTFKVQIGDFAQLGNRDRRGRSMVTRPHLIHLGRASGVVSSRHGVQDVWKRGRLGWFLKITTLIPVFT